MSQKQIKQQKLIILSDINDHEAFLKYDDFSVFDKDIVIEQNRNQLSDNSKLLNYLINNIISKELERRIKNKKIKTIIYILNGSDREAIKSNIIQLANSIPQIRNSIIINIENHK